MEIKLEINDEIFYLNKVAKQSNGAILYQKGDSVLLASVATDVNADIEGDFLPLTVQYIEKSYANARFPKGYIKREGKPNEFEILTSRLIDRSIRPLFPKNYRFPVQITIIVLSVDCNLDIQALALNAASAALLISDIPINRALNGVRIAQINDEFILNPNLTQLGESSIDLFIAGDFENIAMIEFGSQEGELCEDKMLQAISLAQNHINETSQKYMQIFSPYIKKPLDLGLESSKDSNEIYDFINQHYKIALQNCLTSMSKSENVSALNALINEISSKHNLEKDEVESAVGKFKREFIRSQILECEKRLDGRGLDEIRNIDIQTNILPSAHGSTLFTRGETQILAVCTIGSESDMQGYDLITSKNSLKDGFLFHYNFPSFSTGEAYPISSPNRRELGHGNLARKALKSSIKNERRAIRIVSEVLESNGSSSMASVCGGSLSLYAAGLNPSFLVAGIAMGLVKDGEKYKILTDIMGIEDYDGDMDFKVAGNEAGITALQMDNKVGGITLEILQNALHKARNARLTILEKMKVACENIILGKNTPVSQSCQVPTSKIPSIIGQGGKNIREIIERFGVEVDINKENGEIIISSTSLESATNARDYIIQSISAGAESFKVGEKFMGKIKKKIDFGIFVELKNGVDGLIHNSKLIKNNRSMEEFSEGEMLEVEIIAINNDKIELYIS